MLSKLASKIFGSRNQRLISKYKNIVTEIEHLAPAITALKTEELPQQIAILRDKYQNGHTLDALLPEAFALVREAASRALGMRHYPVQLIGGIVLFNGKIAEMRTGEGKTLVATLPASLAALAGEGVHIVTVNDYLAHRDANWMRPVYEMLGLSVGVIKHGMSAAEKQAAYHCDITYGTNNEFGFDYLRDNMVFNAAEKMQRKLYYAIVDEVDSVFIDEARTPLIISGQAKDNSDLYLKINKLIPKLTKQLETDGPGDYTVDEKDKQVYLTDAGHEHVEQLLVAAALLPRDETLYAPQNMSLLHHTYAALRAHVIYKKDVDYIIHDNEVVIVDENTGRTMPGRRWSEGLHQAVEAKEHVNIQSESQTLASITFQNYFRLYEKLAGMTGTADTEAYELQQIYGTEVVVIPTNRPNQRVDHLDMIYLTAEEKFDAIIEDIQDCVTRGQPVLVGTISIEISEFLAKKLKNLKIKHNVLNAKKHALEADIIAEAGRPGAVTIATNMAGRGTDIVLGGNLEAEILNDPDNEAQIRADWQQRHNAVLESGGLHIIGTERHESRRIDNQLRGRAGRQGDKGSTRFYLAITDPLMRRFMSPTFANILQRTGHERGQAITAGMITKLIENAQRKVEGHNFDIRKQLLEYDDVANEQRKVFYQKREALIYQDNINDLVTNTRIDVIQNIVNNFMPPNSMHEEWNLTGLAYTLEQDFGLKLDLEQMIDELQLDSEAVAIKIIALLQQQYEQKEQDAGSDNLRHLEKILLLTIMDNNWKDHLLMMEYIRQSIHLRGYAQQDPKHEYKREAFELFMQMLDNIDKEFIATVSVADVKINLDLQELDDKVLPKQELEYHHQNYDVNDTNDNKITLQDNKFKQNFQHVHRKTTKIGRNELCPCGSGLKYKLCHGSLVTVNN